MAQQNFKDFGLSEEESKNVKDVVPTFNLSSIESGQSAEFRILDVKPREIEYTDKKTKESKKELVLNVMDKLTKMTVTLWLSSKSLRMEFFKLSQKKNGSLKDVNIVISARNYTHDKWGEVRGYSVQETAK